MNTAAKKYTESVGRRKCAVARVRVSESTKPSFLINDRRMEEYFLTKTEQECCAVPLQNDIGSQKFAITVHVRGGGVVSQAEAVRLGLSRTLVKIEPSLRTTLKKAGLLSRNARIKERRKFGLKKARKSPQWSKR